MISNTVRMTFTMRWYKENTSDHHIHRLYAICLEAIVL